MSLTEEKTALLRGILDRRQREVCAMRSAMRMMGKAKRAKWESRARDLQAAIEVASEIYHSSADDAEERIKGLFLNVPPSEYAPPLQNTR